jgi:hypothetical protein
LFGASPISPILCPSKRDAQEQENRYGAINANERAREVEKSKDDVLVYLESANMLEISELVKDIEEKFNVSAAAPVAEISFTEMKFSNIGVVFPSAG